jgi:hypothetical protein
MLAISSLCDTFTPYPHFRLDSLSRPRRTLHQEMGVGAAPRLHLRRTDSSKQAGCKILEHPTSGAQSGFKKSSKDGPRKAQGRTTKAPRQARSKRSRPVVSLWRIPVAPHRASSEAGLEHVARIRRSGQRNGWMSTTKDSAISSQRRPATYRFGSRTRLWLAGALSRHVAGRRTTLSTVLSIRHSAAAVAHHRRPEPDQPRPKCGRLGHKRII